MFMHTCMQQVHSSSSPKAPWKWDQLLALKQYSKIFWPSQKLSNLSLRYNLPFTLHISPKIYPTKYVIHLNMLDYRDTPGESVGYLFGICLFCFIPCTCVFSPCIDNCQCDYFLPPMLAARVSATLGQSRIIVYEFRYWST